MNCETCRSLLDQRLTGGLDEQSLAEMEAHLNACPSCRMLHLVLEDCRTMNEPEEVPLSFSQSWRKAIREEEPAHRATRRMPAKWLAMAAALVMMLTGAWQLGGRQASPDAMRTETYMADQMVRFAPAAEMQAEASEAPDMALGLETAQEVSRAAAPPDVEEHPGIGPWALLGTGALGFLAIVIQTIFKRRNKK